MQAALLWPPTAASFHRGDSKGIILCVKVVFLFSICKAAHRTRRPPSQGCAASVFLHATGSF